MTAYNSSGSGDFSNVATWGGGGYPSIAGDTFTIAAGHTVSVDVYSTIELGASTVNGTLTHKAGGVRRLLFNHNDLTLSSTGNLGGGNMVANGDALILEWNTTADNAKGITKAAGGVINLVGDPAFYGSSDNTVTSATWSSGRVVSVVGDYTAKWANEVLTPVESVTNGTFATDLTGWTGTNWAWNAATTARHTAGSTSALTQAGLAGVVGKLYKLTYAISNSTTGTITPSFGGVTMDADTGNATFTHYMIAGTTGTLALTPTSAFDGDIDNVSVKEVLSGREILIHKNAAYSNYNTDVLRASIHSMTLNGANTDITIGEAAPGATFNSGGIVVYPGRNVIIGKLNADRRIGQYNTLRPRVVDNATVAGSCTVSDVALIGLYQWTNGYSSVFTNSVLRNGFYGFANHSSSSIQGIIFSQGGTGVYQGSNNSLNANGFSSANVATYGTNTSISGNLFSNSSAIKLLTKATVSANIYSNLNGIDKTSGKFSGKLAYNAGTLLANTADVVHDSADISSLDCQIVNAVHRDPIIYSGRNTILRYHKSNVRFEHYNQVFGDHRKYAMFGDVIKNTTTLRTGGAASSIEVAPLSNCSTVNPIEVLGTWTEDNVPAAAQTRSIKVKGEGWAGNFPTNTELYIEAEYYNHATQATTTTAVSTAVLSDNTTWFDIPVTFTPLQVGKVTYRIWMKKYAASCKVYIDNALYKGGNRHDALWSEGESHMQFNFTDWWKPTSGGGN